MKKDRILEELLKDSEDPLSREEEKALFSEYRKAKNLKSKQECKNEILKHYIRLVVDRALKYDNNGVELVDLAGEGSIGLLIAFQKFEPKKRNRFSTVATWWIDQKIRRAIREQGKSIRIPCYRIEINEKIYKTEKKLKQELGRAVADEELYAALEGKFSEKDIAKYRASQKQIFLLSDIIDSESERNHQYQFLDHMTVNPVALAEETELKKRIQNTLNYLKEKEKTVLEMRFGLNGYKPMRLHEIGKNIGVTRERVRQIEAKALRQFRFYYDHASITSQTFSSYSQQTR